MCVCVCAHACVGVYCFKCQCVVDYVDKTIQRLAVRIAQHVQGSIHKYALVSPLLVSTHRI